MFNSNSAVLALTSLFIVGCASPSINGSIIETTQDKVSSCEYVANVHGTSGWGGVAASTGIENSKNEAKQQAIDLGATHLVWQSVSGGFSPSATANTYKCR